MTGSRRQPNGVAWLVERSASDCLFQANISIASNVLFCHYLPPAPDCASPDSRSPSLGTLAVVDRRGRSGLERLTAFPTESSVFHFEVAAISTLDLHHFLRRRRIDSQHARCSAGGGERLLHVCVERVGRHPRL